MFIKHRINVFFCGGSIFAKFCGLVSTAKKSIFENTLDVAWIPIQTSHTCIYSDLIFRFQSENLIMILRFISLHNYFWRTLLLLLCFLFFKINYVFRLKTNFFIVIQMIDSSIGVGLRIYSTSLNVNPKDFTLLKCIKNNEKIKNLLLSMPLGDVLFRLCPINSNVFFSFKKEDLI